MSILISCGVRLAPFDIAEVREITMYDELELDTLGGIKEDPHTKTALFLIMSDTDKTFNFLLSMIYTQLFNLLCEKADDEFGGRLPIHVRCLIDEFAQIGKIPDFEKLIATIRSREISACVILQAQSQLKSMYSDAADTIIGNMDSVLFLGGKESSTLKELSEVLGKQTIDTKTGGESRGKDRSRSTNYQRIGRELMTQDELARMDRGKCILQISGVRPFFSDKYDITKHPRYHLYPMTIRQMRLISPDTWTAPTDRLRRRSVQSMNTNIRNYKKYDYIGGAIWHFSHQQWHSCKASSPPSAWRSVLWDASTCLKAFSRITRRTNRRVSSRQFPVPVSFWRHRR